MIPQYVKCIEIWNGGPMDSIKDKIYNTSVQAEFSRKDWDFIWNRYDAKRFIEATYEEWCKQENIEFEIKSKFFL